MSKLAGVIVGIALVFCSSDLPAETSQDPSGDLLKEGWVLVGSSEEVEGWVMPATFEKKGANVTRGRYLLVHEEDALNTDVVADFDCLSRMYKILTFGFYKRDNPGFVQKQDVTTPLYDSIPENTLIDAVCTAVCNPMPSEESFNSALEKYRKNR